MQNPLAADGRAGDGDIGQFVIDAGGVHENELANLYTHGTGSGGSAHGSRVSILDSPGDGYMGTIGAVFFGEPNVGQSDIQIRTQLLQTIHIAGKAQPENGLIAFLEGAGAADAQGQGLRQCGSPGHGRSDALHLGGIAHAQEAESDVQIFRTGEMGAGAIGEPGFGNGHGFVHHGLTEGNGNKEPHGLGRLFLHGISFPEAFSRCFKSDTIYNTTFYVVLYP